MDINSVNNNESSKIQEFMVAQMMTQMMTNASGDNMGFQIALQSIMSKMDESNSSSDLLNGVILNTPLDELSQNSYLNYRGDLINSIYGGNNAEGAFTNYVSDFPSSGNTTIDDAIRKSSSKYGVDSKLIWALTKQESNFNVNEYSYAGAMGLMQLMPCNVEEYGVTDPYDIYQNIDAGTRHIKDYIELYDGDVKMGLAAYNAGPGTLRDRGVKIPEDIYKLPWETRTHVKKVMEYWKS